ncbi:MULTISPECIES: VanZ family protein [Halorussus]|uniref:VanZ family protein n=1 Tax=Halorussus TaxID=1070314 RepID=UPI0020A21EB5|nr:VanZ family protein [Halorussus vallis]USZ77416.1 VanZ family protein [Halorussus vallis]
MSRIRVPLAPRLVRWSAVALVTGVIAYFSLFDAVPQPPDGRVSIWDKKLHFTAYAGFAYVLAYATADRGWTRTKRDGFVLLAAFAFGVSIELVQGALPARYFGLADVLANLLGACLVVPWFVVERGVRYAPFVRDAK